MPFGEYENFDDCVSKNSDKGDPNAYCGYIQNKVEEALKRKEASEAIKKATENLNDPNLMTPKKQVTEPITNQSPAGEQDEDEQWNSASPEEKQEQLDKANAYQHEPEDKSYDELHPDVQKDLADEQNEDEEKDEKREEQQGQATEQEDELPVPDKPEKIEDENEDKVEYEGESYKLLKINESILKGNVIEYNNKFYTPLKLKEKTGEADIDYEGTVYRPRTNTLIEYNDKIYQKEAENPHTDTDPPQDQALGDKDNVDDARPLELPAEEEISVSGPPAGTEPTVIEDELNKTGESIVVKTRKGYTKLQVYEADTVSRKLENLKNRGLSKDDKKNDKKDDKKEDKESKKKA